MVQEPIQDNNMAHYVKIGVGNVVIETHVLDNDVLMKDGVENEQQGVEFLQNLFSNRDLYIQTSYNNSFRKQFAGIGCNYNQANDVFVEPQPYNSWTLDANHDWQPPTPRPDGDYVWNEETQAWDQIDD
jgi:hypothetical protein